MILSTFQISALYGLALGLIVFFIGSLPRKSLISGQSEWLTDNFFDKLYTAIFANSDPVQICKTFGLEYNKYMIDCSIIGKEPDFAHEAMKRVTGIFAFFFTLPVTLIIGSYIPMVIGAAMFFILSSMPVRSTHNAAESKKLKLLSEMPRYIDLLLAALEINLPIETAIILTAENVPCVLSDELKASFAETALGAKNWSQALESIASKYEIDQLSDFVLNITTAYNKGISVTETVRRQSQEAHKSALLFAKERAAKMTNAVLAPMMIFKMLPLLAILMIPIMMEAMSFLG